VYRTHYFGTRRRATAHTQRGQAITELALIAPVLAIILLGVIALSGAYGAKMDVQSSAAQGARIGALQGNAGKSPLVVAPAPNACAAPQDDPVDLSIVNAILATNGVDKQNITQIQIYKAKADGSIDGTAVNTYVYPFISSSNTLVYNTTPGWPSCTRHPDEPSDSIGVHVTYMYHPIVPLLHHLAITINDQTVQRLNPSQGAKPCPVPPYPNGIAVAIDPQNNPSPGIVPPLQVSNDIVSWSAAALASSYNVYQGIGTINGGVINPTPVATITGGGTSVTIPIAVQAPTVYEVTSVNFCGESERSIDVADGRPDGAATATAQAQATQTAQAQATQTAQAQATQTAVAQSTQAAQAQVSQTAQAQATQTAQVQNTQTAQTQGTQAAQAQATQTAQAQGTQTAQAQGTQTTTAGNAASTAAANATATAAAVGTSVDDRTAGTDNSQNQFNYHGSGSGWSNCKSSTPTPAYPAPCNLTDYPGLYNNTLSYSNQAGDSVSITFSGTGISLYSAKEPIGGIGTVSISGGTGSTTDVDFYAATGAGNQLIWTSQPLTMGTYTLTLTVKGTTNHTGTYVGVDRVVIHP